MYRASVAAIPWEPEAVNIAHCFRLCSVLQFCCSIGSSESVVSLCKALKSVGHRCSVAVVNLRSNSIDCTGAAAIADLLSSKDGCTITALHLGINAIKKKGLVAIAGALRTNTKLSTLNLCNNQLCPFQGDTEEDQEGITALSEALKENTTLTSLTLSASCIGDAGGKLLLDMLQTNTTLLRLDLRWNQMSSLHKVLMKANPTVTRRASSGFELLLW